MDPKELLFKFRFAIIQAQMNGQKEIAFPVDLANQVELILRKDIPE